MSTQPPLLVTWLLLAPLCGCTGTVGEFPVVPDSDPGLPGVTAPTVVDQPASPLDEGGAPLPWPTAPLLEGVQVSQNRDSVVLVLPVVQGAKDYRAFRIPAGVSLEVASGREKVNGTVIACAGFRQHNDKAKAAAELLRQLQVTGLTEPSHIVVEAIDAPCPFPGALGSEHEELQVTIEEVPPQDRVTFSVFTADEIRARYGSLIVNGQGPGPTLAAPAASASAKVLARTTLRLGPALTAPPLATFFDDFRGDDPIRYVGRVDDASRAHAKGMRWESSRWQFISYNAETSHFFVERGQLHMTLADWAQDVFGSMVAYPKKAAQLSDSQYLHVRFEVDSDSTARRYWWLSLCGSDTRGKTLDASGNLLGRIVLTPFFYDPDGYNASAEQWNCLQFFPRDGSPFALAPTMTRSESDIRVMVNLANAPEHDNVVNVSPPQYRDDQERPGWFRTRSSAGKLTAPILDDQLLIAPRTRFDAYVRRDRLILYVNGEPRLCNDFPAHKLTMAEAAIGFGTVLYHSAAERVEFSRSYNLRTGQRHYLSNTPYVDERHWDNLGFEENVSAPSTFDPATCYVAR